MPSELPEPWLRGTIEGVHPLVMPVFFTFQSAREELLKHTAGLTQEQVWSRTGGATPLGFHLKHLAGTVDRLTTYLIGDQLSEAQLAFLRNESVADANVSDLLEALDKTFAQAEEKLRHIDPEALYEARRVGRKGLPTTVIGLIIHIAEHTQRHLGQAITTVKLLRAQSGGLP